MINHLLKKARKHEIGFRAAGALALALPVVLASWLGAGGPGRLELNLGPGDAPYIEGFHPGYEVRGKERTHWTTYNAAIELPVHLEGGPVRIAYHYARDFVQTAEAEILLGGTVVDRFSARGGVFQTRTIELVSVDENPFRLSVLSDSHERRNMGLKLDWLRIDYGDRATVRLAGWNAWRPLLVPAVVFAALLALGWSTGAALALGSLASVPLTVGLLVDPWFTHRLLTGLPLAVTAYALTALLLGAALVRWGTLSPRSRRIVTTLALGAFIVRALFVNHPDFYYPDLRTHATLVETVREAGLDFLWSPAFYIQKHGRWIAEAYGRTYAFPYTPAFHIPFAWSGLSYDATLTWMKLVAAAWLTVPLVLVWALARRFGVPTWGAALMVIVPTYTSRLSFAFLPSLFGHAVDIAFIWWLSGNIEVLDRWRPWITGALFICACQLAYVSSVLNISLFLVLVVVLELVRLLHNKLPTLRRVRALVGMAATGCFLAFAIFYRDFLPMVIDLVRRAAGGAQTGASHYAARSWLQVAYERTRSFFDGIYPVLTALGLGTFGGAGAKGSLIWAWLMTYFLLLLGRARIPDIFTHGHETLFVTPLVCLASGVVLGKLWQGGRIRKGLAVTLLTVLTVQGFYFQWQAISAQLTSIP